jgi:hypothetical protein
MGVGVFGPSNFPVAFGSPAVTPGQPWLLAVRWVPPDELQDVLSARRRVNGVLEDQAQG